MLNTASKKKGKGDKSRTTIIDALAASCLQKYLATRKDNLPWLFVTERGCKRVDTEGIRANLRRFGNSIGVDNVHPHRFRRTFATNLYREGIDLLTIQRLMGHANIATTQRYIDTSDIAVEVAAKRRCN